MSTVPAIRVVHFRVRKCELVGVGSRVYDCSKCTYCLLEADFCLLYNFLEGPPSSSETRAMILKEEIGKYIVS
jgi:hypothetical protein